MTPELQRFVKDPLMQNALQEGMKIQRLNALADGADMAGYDLASMHRANDAGLNSVNTEHLKSMKIGLDKMLEGYRDKTTGKLVLDPEGVAINRVRRALLDHMEANIPGYAEANAAYSGPSAVADAIAIGQNAAGPGQIADKVDAFNKLTEVLKGGHRIGFADKLTQKVTQPATLGANPAQSLLSPKTEPLLRQFAIPEKASPLIDQLKRYDTMSKTRAEALGGSKTVENMADAADTAIDPSFFLNLAHGRFGEAAKSAVSQLGGGATGYREPVRNELANQLLGLNQTETPNLQALVRKLRREANRNDLRFRRGQTGLLSAGAVPATKNSGNK
jgi:hypothetical protein